VWCRLTQIKHNAKYMLNSPHQWQQSGSSSTKTKESTVGRVLLGLPRVPEYSQLSISVASFHFRLQVLRYWWLRNFICPLASLKIDLNVDVIKGCLFKALTLGAEVRWPTTHTSSLAACIKVFPVLTSTRQRLQAFIRRSHRSRFVSPSLPPLNKLCRASDDKLFASITNNREHVLHELLPPQSVASENYNLRPRKHHFELPNKTSHLTECNFMQRMLFLENYWRSILSYYFHFISFIYSSLILTYF